MTQARGLSTRAKRITKKTLLSVSPRSALVLDLPTLAAAVEANSAQIAAISQQIGTMAGQIDSLAQQLEALTRTVRHIEGNAFTDKGTLVGLSERAHLDHHELGQIEFRLERLAGSVQDMTAVHRRLQAIERLLPTSDSAPE